MNLKVGDKVKVRKDLTTDISFNGYDVLEEMLEWAGKIVTIKDIKPDGFFATEENNFLWDKNCIENPIGITHSF